LNFPAFYGISSSYGNNYMNISITYNTIDPITRETISVTKSIIITIPDGNYNSSDLIATILALLLAM
jgi:hypothetical protein